MNKWIVSAALGLLLFVLLMMGLLSFANCYIDKSLVWQAQGIRPCFSEGMALAFAKLIREHIYFIVPMFLAFSLGIFAIAFHVFKNK